MAGLSLCLLLALVAGVALVLTSGPYVAPEHDERGASAGAVDPAGAVQALAALERAVGERQDPGTGPEEVAHIVTNARRLRVADFGLRYVDATGPADDEGRWRAAVETTWRFAGFDTAVARAELEVTFRSAEDGVVVESVGGADRAPLWLATPVQVRRTPETLVLVAESTDDAPRYAALAREAVPVVRRVLPAWPARLVVEVPASSRDLDRALGAEPGTYAGIAAVTATVDGSRDAAAPTHVLVNPEEYDRLRRSGAQVVMRHEAVHVATGVATSSMPLWLLEGFADYVALRDVDLPVSTTAAQIVRQVRERGAPRALPDARAFDVANGRLGAVYESAWLAAVVLAERAGEAGLVRVYESVRDGEDLDAVLGRLAGWDVDALTAAWRERLRDLAA
ncbi:hypothetical protein GHK92_11610 [Nocardioides sp. dk4132]|uniref:hypothetical protein n=1 Tax=unclassified Nocardioides TaxID=2615069 RepID=UPI001297B7FB|nr:MULTISPECIES: hypothetical protein [unclassified Nocardioides]MQW76524.1 hypothetical protein [Nocardioides sp. dk4132]QGA07215.1 hypothetical protein GFH29_07330 [Nocardioides sp. dk884]